MRVESLFSLVCALALFCSCEKAETLYTKAPANFSANNVNTIPALLTAVGNPGMFCTIEDNGSQYVFTSLSESNKVNKEQISIYRGFIMGLGSGFIVGLPNIPLPNEDVARVVCFDIVCRNCHQERSTYPKLQLKEFSRAYCKACQRAYDLNNLGVVIEGSPGDRLYFYRANYVPFVLSISN